MAFLTHTPAATRPHSSGEAQTHLVRHVSKRRVVKVIGRVPADLVETSDGQLKEALGILPYA